MGNEQRMFADAAAESVTEDLRADAWEVYPSYCYSEMGSDARVTAPFLRSKKRKELIDRGELIIYRPLADTPALMLEFAELGGQEITEDVWKDWTERYGVLGLEHAGKLYAGWMRGGPSETLSGFVGEAQRANKALKLYGYATAPHGPDVAAIEQYIPKHYRRFYTETPAHARQWALWEVGTLVQQKLRSEAFPQLYWAPEGYSDAWGFRSLLGAIYLQMMFLLRATGKVRYCRGPGCTNIISFDQPKQPPASGLKKNDRSRGYKTRRDKVYCSDRCKMAYHRKTK
jgi:hypothetical protein